MNRPAHLLLSLSILLSAGCAKKSMVPIVTAPEEDLWRNHDVSLVRLIANPEIFHGKKIAVFGFYRSGSEESAIYPSREMSLTAANGVWIGTLPMITMMEKYPEGIWSRVTGTFNAHSRGHLDRYAGTLENPEPIDIRQGRAVRVLGTDSK